MQRILLLPVLIAAATSAQAADTKQAKITYDDHILPLFREKCISCHGQDKKSSGLSLHSYTKTMEGGSSGVVVKAGDPDGSLLYLAVAHKGEPFMPPKSP